MAESWVLGPEQLLNEAFIVNIQIRPLRLAYLVPDDDTQVSRGPPVLAAGTRNSLLVQVVSDAPGAHAAQVQAEDAPHDLRFSGLDDRLAIFPNAVPVLGRAGDEPLLGPAPVPHLGADAFLLELLLAHRGQDRKGEVVHRAVPGMNDHTGTLEGLLDGGVGDAAPGQAVLIPGHDDVEGAGLRVLQHRLEGGPVLTVTGVPGILVHLGHVPTVALAIGPAVGLLLPRLTRSSSAWAAVLTLV
jgi:hypothetical protein